MNLEEYLSKLQAEGQYFFLKEEVMKALGYSKKAFIHAAIRLRIKHRLCNIRISNVATVLSELKEKFILNEFIKVATPNLYEWPILQRLGYLLSLEKVGAREFADPIQKLILKHKPRFVPLVHLTDYENSKKDLNWRIYVNEEVELDL